MLIHRIMPLALACGLAACAVPVDDGLATQSSAISQFGNEGGFDRAAQGGRTFDRIATFPVFLNTDIDTDTVAEIVAATEDGNTLIYTDSDGENIGFVDITNPFEPSGRWHRRGWRRAHQRRASPGVTRSSA